MLCSKRKQEDETFNTSWHPSLCSIRPQHQSSITVRHLGHHVWQLVDVDEFFLSLLQAKLDLEAMQNPHKSKSFSPLPCLMSSRMLNFKKHTS